LLPIIMTQTHVDPPYLASDAFLVARSLSTSRKALGSAMEVKNQGVGLDWDEAESAGRKLGFGGCNTRT
jgi:hypothetical protein